jgi:hypothetical protein
MTKEEFKKEQARVKREYDILIDNPESLRLFLQNEDGPADEETPVRIKDQTKKRSKHRHETKNGTKHKTRQHPMEKEHKHATKDGSRTEPRPKHHPIIKQSKPRPIHEHKEERRHKHEHHHHRNHDDDFRPKHIKQIVEADPDSLIIEHRNPPRLVVDVGKDTCYLHIGEKSFDLGRMQISHYSSFIEEYAKNREEYKAACKIIAEYLRKESYRFARME